ncbi:YolD-like family protein [Thermoflavimicrobium dichotomicum]|uniref:YolD-like protein n=1 Tax=Thermoflavimicrobium dichotomicum TaxID=46223 RepID=A0A1I3RKU1_9BACL|nr:YolD-like family protein [Thermoflavimicrobium dichotomicum]SFJ47203.1 YolD-like protein [Thermoflavimicrobium dichotomicum]
MMKPLQQQNGIIPPETREWLTQKQQTPIPYVRPHLDKEQLLQFSIKIQTAYEQERPLLILFNTPFGSHQFAGYVGQIDPHERWIQLINGSIKKQISLAKIIDIELY